MRLSRVFTRWVNGGGGAHVELGTDPFPSVDPVNQDPRPDNIALFRWRYENSIGHRLIASFKPPGAPCPAMHLTVFVWDSLNTDWLQIASKLADPDRPERFDLVDVLPDKGLSSQADHDSFETYIAIVATPQVGQLYPDGAYGIASGIDFGLLSEKDVTEAVQAALAGYMDPQFPTAWTASQYGDKGQLVADPTGIYHLQGFNDEPDGTARRYLMIFDADAEPADGATPIFEYLVPTTGTYNQWLPKPRMLTLGLYWAVSSTPVVLAKVAGAQFSIQAEVVI